MTMDNSTQKLETLIKRRDSLKSKLRIFKKYIEEVRDRRCDSANPLSPVEICSLEQRIGRIDPLLIDFDEIQGEIDCISEDTDAEFVVREEFEDLFQNTTAIAKELLANYKKVTDANLDTHSVVSSAISVSTNADLNGIRLPVIQIPEFDGTYERWLEFRDTFQSLIHENDKITDIQKFHYLRASLQDDAAEAIQALEFSAANYQIAWDSLKDRFNSTRLLVYNHVKALFNLERINSESSLKIRRLIDNVSKHLKSLDILGQPTKHWDTLVIYIIMSKLDEVTVREWENYMLENDTPTLENLKQFLKRKADLLKTLESRHDEREDHKMINGGSRCAFCKGPHDIQDCDDFLKLSTDERTKQAKKARVCTICLTMGHYKNHCKAAACEKCGAKHNVLLHPEGVREHN